MYSGLSQRNAAKIHGVSRTTVSTLVNFAKQQGWFSEEELSRKTHSDFLPAVQRKPGVGANRNQAYQLPNYHYIHEELGKKHVTLQLLWEEYVAECIEQGLLYYKLTQFTHYYKLFAQSEKATIRLQHKPGLELQVDWAGSRLLYFDEDAGELRKASLFVAVLPCSQLVFVDVFPSEEMRYWIAAHVNCFKYLGGVPSTLVPYNLKTGVTKANFLDPDLNKIYQEMANHYGTTIMPARVRKPKDKAAVENSVKIVSHRIIGALRHANFHNFTELSESVALALERINTALLTGKSVSRWSAFLSEEKDYLLTLPAKPFVISEWGKAKVQPNCHIAFQKYFYSVPFELVGEEVDIRATDHTIEIFYHHERVASHKRSWGREIYTTLQDHMPPGKLFYVNWNGERFLQWAAKIGPSCKQAIKAVLDAAVVEQHAYRTCFGILELAKKYSEIQLEQACAYLLGRKARFSYRLIKQVIEDQQKTNEPCENNTVGKRGFRRGNDYFKATEER